MERAELDRLFECHKTWVETGGCRGKQIYLDEEDLRCVDFVVAPIEQGFYSACNFSGTVFSKIDFYLGKFYSCHFEHCVFCDCDFRKTTLDYSIFAHSEFKNCMFPRADAYETDFRNCRFSCCSFVGFNLMNANLDGALIESSDMDAAYFDAVSVNKTVFKNLAHVDSITHLSLLLTAENAIRTITDETAVKLLRG